MEKDMLARVRKLLAKAEAAGVTEEERDALTAKAADLMAKYGIDEALANAREPGRDQIIDKRIVLDPPFAVAKSTLFWAVANPLRCKAVRIETPTYDGKNRYRYTMHIFGFQADIERVELLYTSLLLQAANGLKDVQIPWGVDKGAYRDSWLEGFASAVYLRLQLAEQKAASQAEDTRTEGMSVALVLADRSSLVEAAYASAHPDTRSGRGRQLSGGGGSAGYRAGQKADLGTSRNVGRGSVGSLASR